MKVLDKASRIFSNIFYTMYRNMSTHRNVIVRNIDTLRTPASYSSQDRMIEVENQVDATKYRVLGFINRTNQVVLEPLFHNVRDSRGRFA